MWFNLFDAAVACAPVDLEVWATTHADAPMAIYRWAVERDERLRLVRDCAGMPYQLELDCGVRVRLDNPRNQRTPDALAQLVDSWGLP